MQEPERLRRAAAAGGARPRTEAELITEMDTNTNRSGISEDIDNQFYVEMLSGADGETPTAPAP